MSRISRLFTNDRVDSSILYKTLERKSGEIWEGGSVKIERLFRLFCFCTLVLVLYTVFEDSSNVEQCCRSSTEWNLYFSCHSRLSLRENKLSTNALILLLFLLFRDSVGENKLLWKPNLYDHDTV